jgi:hypothetical protein
MQGVGIGATIEGIQRCFCMDIQKIERDSNKVGTTLELDITIPPAHQAMYRLNTNYAMIVK